MRLTRRKLVRARIDEFAPNFPPGLKVVYPYDTTPFVRISIEEVVKTLFEGIVLVFLVMYLFLQNFRATLIPTIAVPVVLLGTFGIMAAFGFTINTLTMFGLVLAIGLLVDDAIVVVENVERVMSEEGLSPKEATRKAMGQITGALIGVAVVLSAVFVPVAFSAGSVGAIYRQFSLTIVSAMLLSVFVALSLTPALCATMLKPAGKGGEAPKRGFFGAFNRGFERGRDQYIGGVRHVINRFGRWLLIYGAVIVAVGLLFVRLPTGISARRGSGHRVRAGADAGGCHAGPHADRARRRGEVPAGRGSGGRRVDVRHRGFQFRGARTKPGPGLRAVQGLVTSESAPTSKCRRFWTARPSTSRHTRMRPSLRSIRRRFPDWERPRASICSSWIVPGWATTSSCRRAISSSPRRGRTRTSRAYTPTDSMTTPTYKIDIDREKASAFGINLSDVDQTFSIAWGSRYVNNFLDTDGRIKRVYVQADAPFRMNPEDLRSLYVRNTKGSMVPFTSFASGSWTYGSPKLERYNGVSSMQIQGQAAPGQSTGQAIAAMEKLAQKLPAGIGYEWTGISLQERQSGSQAPLLYALSILVVFLCLAALYESWSIPVSVIMVVPIGILGAVAAATALRPGKRRLLPGRSAGHDRVVLEECHPDRRVRARPRSPGQHRQSRPRSKPRICGCGRS